MRQIFNPALVRSFWAQAVDDGATLVVLREFLPEGIVEVQRWQPPGPFPEASLRALGARPNLLLVAYAAEGDEMPLCAIVDVAEHLKETL